MEGPQLLEPIRRPYVIEYDTTRYPFREALLAILNEDGEEEEGPLPTADLSELHKYPNHKCSTHDVDKAGNAIAHYQVLWNKNRDRQDEAFEGQKRAKPSTHYARFEDVYRSFIRDVVGPSVLRGPHEEAVPLQYGLKVLGPNTVLFQRTPTFRTQLPSASPIGKMHTDEGYHHQPSELNFWMPLSDHVQGNNSLWVESSPGKGDFAPLLLKYGQCYRGYLNKCRHHTVANDTDRTRASLDFRVVCDRSGGHDPNFHKGVRRGAKARFESKFDVGGFYEIMELPE